jgi:glycosyltransferase involved in cell wall biosynthesis
MAVYAGDKPEWFRTAVQSAVFEQTRPVDQVVLVVDGPVSPEYEEVIDRIRCLENSIVIQLRVNSGLAAALNEGMKHCSSDYVARFDSDDICHPRRIELQMAYLEHVRDVDVLGTQIREFDENMKYCFGLRLVPCDHESIRHFSKKRSPVNHMTVIYKKNAVMDVGGYPKLHGREDYGLWIKLLSNGYIFANLPDVLVNSRGGLPMLKRRGGQRHIIPEWNLHKYKISNNLYLKYYSYFILTSRIIVALLPVSLRGLCYRFVRFRRNGKSARVAETAVIPQIASGVEQAAISDLEIPSFHFSECEATKRGIYPPERDERNHLQDQEGSVHQPGREILAQDELG